MRTSDILAQKSAEAVIESLHDGAMAQAIDALAGVLARNEARRLLPELRQERERRADALPGFEQAIHDAETHAAETRKERIRIDVDLLELGDRGDFSTAEQWAHYDALNLAKNRAAQAERQAKHAPEMARRRLDHARDALALLDGKIDALEAMDVDAASLRELGKALA